MIIVFIFISLVSPLVSSRTQRRQHQRRRGLRQANLPRAPASDGQRFRRVVNRKMVIIQFGCRLFFVRYPRTERKRTESQKNINQNQIKDARNTWIGVLVWGSTLWRTISVKWPNRVHFGNCPPVFSLDSHFVSSLSRFDCAMQGGVAITLSRRYGFVHARLFWWRIGAH